MGIQGLLPFLAEIQQHTHLREFAGKTVGVDGYVWLHRGAYACATELVTGKPTTKYVQFAMERVRLMQHHHVMPYVVFDGGPLPAKLGTEEKRKQQREANLAQANLLASQGRHSEARDLYTKCLDVTPQMAYQVIKALRAANIPYIVAPYEADAQLAYLERQGLIDAILTEDSDLLVFGARQALFKLDSSGECVSVCRADFGSPALPNPLAGWGDDQFRWMAMLAGCDYLDSILGVGLKTAHKLLRKYRTVEKVVQVVRFEGKMRVPRDYLDRFRVAELAFLHQRVYDPTTERLVHFTPPPEGELDEEKQAFVGADMEPELARRVAQGLACPISLAPMVDINPAFDPQTKQLNPAVVSTGGVGIPGSSSSSTTPGSSQKKSGSRGGPLDRFFAKSSTTPTPPSKKAVNENTAAVSGIKRPVVNPRGSGKRTLVDIMNEEAAARTPPTPTPTPTPVLSTSALFAASVTPRKKRRVSAPQDEEQETQAMILDPVEQEDGYVSPAASRSDSPDELSSPVRGVSCDADFLSSPPARVPARKPVSAAKARGRTVHGADVDLEDVFTGRAAGDASDEDEDEAVTPDQSQSQIPRVDVVQPECDVDNDLDLDSDEEQAARRARIAVGRGWRAKFALHPSAVGSPRTPLPLSSFARTSLSALRSDSRTPLSLSARQPQAKVLVQASSSVEDLSAPVERVSEKLERDSEFEADEAIDSEDEPEDAFVPQTQGQGRLMQRFACARR